MRPRQSLIAVLIIETADRGTLCLQRMLPSANRSERQPVSCLRMLIAVACKHAELTLGRSSMGDFPNVRHGRPSHYLAAVHHTRSHKCSYKCSYKCSVSVGTLGHVGAHGTQE